MAVQQWRDLETAQLELDELLEPPDELDLLRAENNLAQAKELKQKAEDNLEKSYEDGFNDVTDAFLDLPTIMGGLKDILFGNDFNLSQANIDYYSGSVEIYNNSVTPVISSGNVILNNDIYISNTEITNPGNYEFIVNGANNYTENLSFTITSNLEGIINNNIYIEPITLDFNGNGYLNNQFIESPYEVIESGDYIFKIRGENNYMETYFFSIEEEVNETSFIDFVQRVDILVLVVVLISGGIILKKK